MRYRGKEVKVADVDLSDESLTLVTEGGELIVGVANDQVDVDSPDEVSNAVDRYSYIYMCIGKLKEVMTETDGPPGSDIAYVRDVILHL